MHSQLASYNDGSGASRRFQISKYDVQLHGEKHDQGRRLTKVVCLSETIRRDTLQAWIPTFR